MHDALTAWLRQKREERGISAIALSRAAGMGKVYVTQVETGKARPKSATVDKLADALGLSDAERQEFHRLARRAGEPSHVVEALTGPAIPGLAMWKHLPELLYARRDPRHDWLVYAADDVLTHAVPAIGSLLAWAALKHGIVKRLRAGLPGESSVSSRLFATAGLWRSYVFRDRRSTARLARLVERWTYTPGAVAPARPDLRIEGHFISVQLAGALADDSVEAADCAVVLALHDAMIVRRLLTPIVEYPAALHAAVRYLVTDPPDQAALTRDPRRTAAALSNVRQALRLFDEPPVPDEKAARAAGGVGAAEPLFGALDQAAVQTRIDQVARLIDAPPENDRSST